MYKFIVEKFGIHDIYCLSNNNSNCFLKFVPTKGATVFDLRLKGQKIYDGYTSPEDLDSLIWGRGILMAPFPNRLKNGKYSFEGKNYQFPVNEPATGAALHGFINQLKFIPKKPVINPENASVSCHTFYDGQFEYYPFPFTAEVKYSLSKDDTFSLNFKLTNAGKTNMPVGLGWHPYFRLDESVTNTKLHLPDLDMVEVDGNMIPTGNYSPFTVFENKIEIQDLVIDNCFQLKNEAKLSTVVLEDKRGKLTYSQKSNAPYLQIFIPPHRQSIALEPMTCNIDALNNKEGLRVLAPNESIDLDCSVNLA